MNPGGGGGAAAPAFPGPVQCKCRCAPAGYARSGARAAEAELSRGLGRPRNLSSARNRRERSPGTWLGGEPGNLGERRGPHRPWGAAGRRERRAGRPRALGPGRALWSEGECPPRGAAAGTPRGTQAFGETCPGPRAAGSPGSPVPAPPRRSRGALIDPPQLRAGPGRPGAPPQPGRLVSGMTVCRFERFQFERFHPLPFSGDELLTLLLFPQFPAAPPCWWSSPPTSTSVASASSSSITSMPSLGTSKAVANSPVQRPGPLVRSSLCRKKRCHRHRHKPKPGPSLRRPKPSQVFWCYIPGAWKHSTRAKWQRYVALCSCVPITLS